MHFLVHFALAGIGVYVLARSWGQTYLGAFFAAIVFMLSGPVLSLGDLYNASACAAWIPWALLVTDRALASPRLRPWILLIVIFSFQWLAGEPLTMLATFGLCFAYAFYRCGVWGKLWSKPNFRLLAIFFLVGAGMMLLCAAQFLPASNLLSQSRRGMQGLRFRETANWAVNPFSLPEMIVPDFFGSGIGRSHRLAVVDVRLEPALIFFPSLWALCLSSARWPDGRWGTTAAATSWPARPELSCCFPSATLRRSLPWPICFSRRLPWCAIPSSSWSWLRFLLAILAGWGFDALRSPASPWKTHGRRLLTPLKIFLGCILAVLAVAWMLPALIMSPTRWVLSTLGETPFNLHQMPDFLVTMLRYQLPGLAGFCLGGIVLAYGLEQGKSWARPGLYAFALLAIGQLVAVNSGANPTVPKTFFTYRPPVLEEFKDPPGTYRVASFWPIVQTPGHQNLQTYINFESIPEAADFGPMAQGAFQARLQLATGSMLNQVEGSINLDLERSLPPYLYDVEIYQDREATRPVARRLPAGPHECEVHHSARARRFRRHARHRRRLQWLPDCRAALYEDLCFVPRTYVAGNSLFSTNSAETLDHLASPDFDALNTVILAAAAGHHRCTAGLSRHVRAG